MMFWQFKLIVTKLFKVSFKLYSFKESNIVTCYKKYDVFYEHNEAKKKEKE